MTGQKQAPFTKDEQTNFRLCLAFNKLTYEGFARQFKYQGQYVRQVISNRNSSNYLRLLIRNYIRSISPHVIKFLQKN